MRCIEGMALGVACCAWSESGEERMRRCKAAAVVSGLPPPIRTSHTNNDNNSRGRSRRTRWSTTGRGVRPPLPLLLRRPRLPPPPTTTASTSTRTGCKQHRLLLLLPALQRLRPHRINDGDDKEEEDEDGGGCGSQCASATPSDVLSLMDALQVPVEADLYLSLVKECTVSRDAIEGARVHTHIQRSSPLLLRLCHPDSLLLANRVVLMYAACRKPESARQLFDQMPARDVVSWSAMIAALADSGSHVGVLQLFVEMLNEDTHGTSSHALLDAAVVVLRSCVQLGDLGIGQQLHGLMLKIAGGPGHHQLGSPLIQLYGTMGCQEHAGKLLDSLNCGDAAVWTSMMITAYCRRGLFREGVLLFREMARRTGRRTNNSSYLFSSTLAACAEAADEGWSGRQVHAHAIKAGAAWNQFVRSALVKMYGGYGLLSDAIKVFLDETIDGGGGGGKHNACWNGMDAQSSLTRKCSPAPDALHWRTG